MAESGMWRWGWDGAQLNAERQGAGGAALESVARATLAGWGHCGGHVYHPTCHGPPGYA